MTPQSAICVLFAFFACAVASRAAPSIVRNLVTDYGAGEGDASPILQKALDEVGAAGGGTVVLPARAGEWLLQEPIYISDPNVTVAGEGSGTRVNGPGILFVLGASRRYPEAISPGHFPPITDDSAMLDPSVTEAKFGLRTFDGKVRASGYFPACALAYGTKIARDPSGNYWKDYEIGAGKPGYWRNWPRYTINLAVCNNSASPMRGVICGVGAGGLSRALTTGGIADPLTVWTIESDAADGRNLAFKFNVVDREGKESIRVLPLSTAPAGEGMLRISIQLDMEKGLCRAWCGSVSAPVLSGSLELGAGYKLRAFEYGAFHLGRVSGHSFSGSPSDGGAGGDWTYCGYSLFSESRYSIGGTDDRIGSAQHRLGGADAPADDRYRYFPEPKDPGLIAFLPLSKQEPGGAIACRGGAGYDGASAGPGYWLPDRENPSVGGVITLRDMHLFGDSMPITIAAASHVVLENIYEGGGGFQGVGSFHCEPEGSVLELRNCRLVGWDASLFARGQNIKAENLSGGSGETMLRLVGCRGSIDHVVITGFIASDYYVKLHAGERGGSMRISEFCIDNEGLDWAPGKACFYAEPSLDGGPEGNRLSFRGTIYTGSLSTGQAVIELADTPGLTRSASRLDIDGIDLWSNPKKPASSVIRCKSDLWTGDILQAETHWAEVLSRGIIDFTGVGKCGIVSHHEDGAALPSKGAWLAGCHIFRMADARDETTGAWAFASYRCTQSGVYGSDREPKWEKISQ